MNPTGARIRCRSSGHGFVTSVLRLAIAAIVAGSVPIACIGNPPESCRVNSDCGSDSFCDGDGFCYSECRRDADCPCGSTCAASCGMCIRDDQRGPATCVPYQHGLTTAEVLGACLRPDGGVPVSRSSTETDAEVADAGTDSRDCPLQLPTLPICVPSPPVDGGSAGGGGSAGASPDGGMGGDIEAGSGGTGGAP